MIIFDLKASQYDWHERVNQALEKDWPEYLETYGMVGSDKWWQCFERGEITVKRTKGQVTFVGVREDFFGEVVERPVEEL